jgi:hypothetical protein
VHTAAIGTAQFAGDAAIELVLVQPPNAACPVLTLHLVTPTARVSIDITGTQAWTLAGVLIDATVAHAQAMPSRCGARLNPSIAPSSRQAEHRARPQWLLDRHPNGRMPRARTLRSFRCPPARRPTIDGDGLGGAGVAE